MDSIVEVNSTGDLILSSGGVRIFVWSWHPIHDARGVVIIVPGFNAHGGRYDWVAERLNASGIAVYAVDLRGRGKSDGERFYIEEFSDYMDDLSAAFTLVESKEERLPIFLLGHSAGGVVACLFTLERQKELAGLICESFSLELPAPGIALSALKGLSHIMPHAHVVRLKSEDFSRDPDVVNSMNSDPLISAEIEPANTIAEMTRAGERLQKLLSAITLPVLILHGTEDKIARSSGSQRFYDLSQSGDKTLRLYEGNYHDLLSDNDKEQVVADIEHWINVRLGDR